MAPKKNVVLLTQAEDLRERIRNRLRLEIGKAIKVVPDGAMDGTRVVRDSDLFLAISEAFDGTPLPEASEHAVAVRTPGRVVVTAYCPKCSEPIHAAITLDAELKVIGNESSIKLKGSTKPVDHVCGQRVLPIGVADGQELLPLDKEG